MKNYTFLFLTIILFSCTSVEIQEFNDNELNIDENLLRGIYGNGYERPSEIQKKAIKKLYPYLLILTKPQKINLPQQLNYAIKIK